MKYIKPKLFLCVKSLEATFFQFLLFPLRPQFTQESKVHLLCSKNGSNCYLKEHSNQKKQLFSIHCHIRIIPQKGLKPNAFSDFLKTFSPCSLTWFLKNLGIYNACYEVHNLVKSFWRNILILNYYLKFSRDK